MVTEQAHILLVNDKADVLLLIRKTLELSGFHNLATCHDGLSACRYLGQQAVDLLLTDIHMPNIDGWRLCRMVRSGIFRCASDTPIVVVSSTFGERIAEATAREFGVDRFLQLAQVSQAPRVVRECLRGAAGAGGRRPSLLVIEDSPASVALIQAALTNRFDIEVAMDGQAGLTAWRQRRHDLVLLDLMLPQLPGEGVLQGILATHPTQPVVIMSALSDTTRYQAMMLQGAADLIKKPFSTEQLRQVCEIALRRDDYLVLNQQFAAQATRQEPTQAAVDQPPPAPDGPVIQVFTLGNFELRVDGQPLILRQNSQPKPLELLKALIALGGRNVNAALLAELLWPDSEGDTAMVALNTTLHRLRKLLDQRQAVGRRHNRLYLDDTYCWVDAWAFESLGADIEVLLNTTPPPADERLEELTQQVITLYRGAFLAGDGDPQWGLAYRERLENRWLRLIGQLGRYWERCNAWERAVELYRRALETNTLAEDLYRRLMECYQTMERPADAQAVGQRYLKHLAMVGVEPSPGFRSLLRGQLRKR